LAYARDQLKSLVEKIHGLPTIAKVGMKILELASDPEVSMSALSEAIHQDPSLAARVLKVANSPFYGMPRQVDSLQLALVILGLNEVRTVALGLSLFNVIKTLDSHVTYDRQKFWIHSAGCGIVARILGRKLNFRSEGTDFIVGLLHDMGKIIIDEYFGNEFTQIFKKTQVAKVKMLEAEREFLGASHERIGGWLAEKWRLPDTLCDAIIYHHESPNAEPWHVMKDPRLVSLAYIAEAFCEYYDIGWDGDAGYSDVRDREVWHTLLSGQDAYSPDDIDLILTETFREFNDARPHIMAI
jgi:HD-like signal output (HDOD) protein